MVDWNVCIGFGYISHDFRFHIYLCTIFSLPDTIQTCSCVCVFVANVFFVSAFVLQTIIWCMLHFFHHKSRALRQMTFNRWRFNYFAHKITLKWCYTLPTLEIALRTSTPCERLKVLDNLHISLLQRFQVSVFNWIAISKFGHRFFALCDLRISFTDHCKSWEKSSNLWLQHWNKMQWQQRLNAITTGTLIARIISIFHLSD